MNTGKTVLHTLLDTDGYNYRITKEDIGTQLNISKGDLFMLNMYRNHKNKTITTLLHVFVGLGIKCYEEKHDQYIRELEIKLAKANYTLKRYHQRYGPIAVARPRKLLTGKRLSNT